jgi:hypothetical protein
VTLGSIHENILEMCIDNPYLESKKELEQFLEIIEIEETGLRISY